MASLKSIIVGVALLINCAVGCEITSANVTWHFTDQVDTFIPGIDKK